MKSWFPVLVLLAGLGSSISFTQSVCLSPDGKPCFADPDMRRCANEKVLPNLSITKPVKLSGVLLDETGAPILYDRTLIQIRDLKAEKVLFTADLDGKGQFDLGDVPAGKFCFLVIWLNDGKIRRLPIVDQPKDLLCSAENVCNLKIVIHFHGTDNPIDSCLPK
ncbi:MAG: hypothetical protein ABSD72_17730 [Terracidiphilus sp.]|jgi:hypothetical protein